MQRTSPLEKGRLRGDNLYRTQTFYLSPPLHYTSTPPCLASSHKQKIFVLSSITYHIIHINHLFYILYDKLSGQ